MEDKHSEYFKRIGKNLRKRRINQGLSQDRLAKKIPKMDRSKISDMENGKEDFMFSKLLNICDALDMTVLEALQEPEEESI